MSLGCSGLGRNEVIDSEKVVAQTGERVIDHNAITVSDQQGCMNLCPLEAGPCDSVFEEWV